MQQFQLSIPEPCHQSWQEMTPTEQGRFCSACAKEVVDFSTMSDYEVLNYFNQRTNQNVCGRAMPSQLERTLSPSREPAKKRLWYWHYITMLLLFFNKSANAKPHGGISITKIDFLKDQTVSDLLFTLSAKNKNVNRRIISGKITDDKGKGIPYVTVAVKGTRRTVRSDAYGVYVIKVDTDTEMLELSATGFPTKIFRLAGLQTYNFNLASPASEDIVVMAGWMVRKTVTENKTIVSAPLKISGNIIDQIGNAVPYASIKISGSATGVSADSAGNFSVTINDRNASVEISSLGYTSKTIAARDITAFTNVVLEKADMKLPEVVVHAYDNRTVGRLICTTGGMTVVRGKEIRTVSDTLKSIFSFKKSAVTLYPNPVIRGSQFHLSINLKQAETYMIKISDAAGAVVFKQELINSLKSQSVALTADSKWSKGIYFLTVTDSKNKLISTNSFSVQ